MLLRTLALAFLLAPALPALAQAQQQITIDAHASSTPFPHFWEQIFGSGRANLMLRERYLDDLRAVHAATHFSYVRGHGILDDENGVYTEDEHGEPVYNFAYVDQIYDGLLANGVKPFVELSFMPKKLAFNPDALHPFWYKPNVSPPKSMERWDALIRALAQHLVARYGIDEVAQWYFEVWNEPNIDFWNGIPRDTSYFELYDHTARALTSVSPRLRVGGPATAAASWIPEFLRYTKQHGTPVSFVSSHGYADDTIDNLFPNDPSVPRDTPLDDRVCLAIHKVRKQMDQAGYQATPLFWTEWNVEGQSESRDTTFVGPGVANTVRECDGAVAQMSFWTFSDVFEEGGPISKPFEGNFGLRASFGINKPSFYDFALLHQLGTERIANPADNILVTRDSSGLAIALWNISDPPPDSDPNAPHAAKADPSVHPPSSTRPITLHFTGVAPGAAVSVARVDNEHGNVLPIYRELGSPQTPTRAQVEEMNKRTALPSPAETHLSGGSLSLTLEPNALLLIHVSTR